MKTLYIHPYSGIAGDMMLGALVDLGVDLAQVSSQLERLGLSGYEIDAETVIKNGIAGTKVHVRTEEGHHHRGLSEIQQIIQRADLDEWVKEKSTAIFTLLAEAEAKVHGTGVEDVHFHEVGALDAIVDIVGTCIALNLLGRPQIISAPLHLGTGFVEAAHGIIPVPAPATLEILARRQVPTYSRGIYAELVTPTGAAIVAALTDEFGPQPAMEINKVGYGAGSRNLSLPNFVRLVLGEQKKNKFDIHGSRSLTSAEHGRHEHRHHHHH